MFVDLFRKLFKFSLFSSNFKYSILFFIILHSKHKITLAIVRIKTILVFVIQKWILYFLAKINNMLVVNENSPRVQKIVQNKLRRLVKFHHFFIQSWGICKQKFRLKINNIRIFTDRWIWYITFYSLFLFFFFNIIYRYICLYFIVLDYSESTLYYTYNTVVLNRRCGKVFLGVCKKPIII